MKKIICILGCLLAFTGCTQSREDKTSVLAPKIPLFADSLYACSYYGGTVSQAVIFSSDGWMTYGTYFAGNTLGYKYHPVGEFTYQVTESLDVETRERKQYTDYYAVIKEEKVYLLKDQALSIEEMDQYEGDEYCILDNTQVSIGMNEVIVDGAVYALPITGQILEQRGWSEVNENQERKISEVTTLVYSKDDYQFELVKGYGNESLLDEHANTVAFDSIIISFENGKNKSLQFYNNLSSSSSLEEIQDSFNIEDCFQNEGFDYGKYHYTFSVEGSSIVQLAIKRNYPELQRNWNALKIDDESVSDLIIDDTTFVLDGTSSTYSIIAEGDSLNGYYYYIQTKEGNISKQYVIIFYDTASTQALLMDPGTMESDELVFSKMHALYMISLDETHSIYSLNYLLPLLDDFNS